MLYFTKKKILSLAFSCILASKQQKMLYWINFHSPDFSIESRKSLTAFHQSFHIFFSALHLFIKSDAVTLNEDPNAICVLCIYASVVFVIIQNGVNSLCVCIYLISLEFSKRFRRLCTRSPYVYTLHAYKCEAVYRKKKV